MKHYRKKTLAGLGKKAIRNIAIVLAVLLVLAPFSLSAIANNKTATVNASALNIRQQPNTTAAILTTVKNGTTLTVVEDSVNGWTKIKYNSIEGYVYTTYITVQAAPVVSQPTTSGGNLSIGSQGEDVFALQEDLRAVGLFFTNSTSYFGSYTQESVKIFQSHPFFGGNG